MEEEVIEKYKKAGKIAKEALEFGASLIKPDVKAIDVTKAIEEKIISLGGKFAFPVNISINEVAAHYTPKENDELVFKKGDVVKLDIGVHVDGYIADTAITVDLGENKELVKASEEALKAAIETIRPGIEVWEIGKVVEETIKSFGFVPIANLTGHSLDKFELHSGKTIPNVDNKSKTKIEEGDAIAIEPFATTGNGYVIDSAPSEIYSLIDVKPVRSPMERKVIEYIAEEYKMLPFCKRWIVNKFGAGSAFAIRNLVRQEVLHNYPILREEARGLVSQREKTVLVLGGENIVTT